MEFAPQTLYHFYNRGNQSQTIFPQKRNYDFFLKKAEKELCPFVDVIAYCLMPNHFHFLIYTHEIFESRELSEGVRILLSSFTRAIQKQEGFTGSLFQQNSKAKELTDFNYATTCLHYIHQNPLKARLVNKLEDWQYSSFFEYWKERKFVNVELGRSLLDLSADCNLFYKESYGVINDDLVKKIL